MSNCIEDFQKTGVGLLGPSLSGTFSFVFDTGNYGSWIKSYTYSPNEITQGAELSAYINISDYSCDFHLDNSIYLPTTSLDISYLELTGRYVQMYFDVRRDAVSSVSPRVFDVNIDFSYDKQEFDYKTIFKLKNDIFGFEYALLKEDLDLDYYSYKLLDGEVLTKDIQGKVQSIEEILPSAFSKYENIPNLYSEMLTGVKDMEVFFDTLMFVTSGYVVFEKLVYSYDTNELSVDPTNSKILDLNALSATYSDVWFFEHDNYMLTFLMQEIETPKKILVPKVYKLDFVNNDFYEMVIDGLESLDSLCWLDVSEFEVPVVTFDNHRKVFNIGCLVFDQENEYNILSMNLQYDQEQLYIKEYDVISPVDYRNV